MIKHFNIKIIGFVQGIYYRATAKEKADQLGIKGFAQNEKDGSVYIEAEGEKESLDKFIEWCQQGPELAKVDQVKFEKSKIKNFAEFKVY